MITEPFNGHLRLVLLLLTIMCATVIATTTKAVAAEPVPVKLVLSNPYFLGSEVNLTEVEKHDGYQHENICTGEGKPSELPVCQKGKTSANPGGFEYPNGVAAAPNGNIYVADTANRRVQELKADGEFILMFGKEVNETTKGNICTEEEIKTSGVKCKAGVESTAVGVFGEPQDVAVETGSEDVYVLDQSNWRVEKYTAAGQFVLMFGKEVNETKVNAVKAKSGTPTQKELEEENVCTQTEISTESVKCKVGVRSSSESLEESAFDFDQFQGDLLDVVGSTVYVGDAHRVQEFGPQGEWKGEIRLSPTVISSEPKGEITTIAADAQTVFVVYNFGSRIYEFESSTGKELASVINVAPRVAGKPVEIRAIALNQSGYLAVSADENEEQFGELYEAGDGAPVTQFTVPGLQYVSGVNGITFSASGELYAVVINFSDVMRYLPRDVASLKALPAGCVPGPERATDVTFTCDLEGEVDPNGVAGTEVWFQWGRTQELGNETELQPIKNFKEPPVEGETGPFTMVSAAVEGVRPNESSFYYRLAGTDDNLSVGEILIADMLSFKTSAVPPRIVGDPRVPFVRNTSAVMFGELNPENTNTTYEFQYAPLEEETCEELNNCAGILSTTPVKSAVYGKVGTTGEATGLRPGTTYLYRLYAVNENGEEAVDGTGGGSLPEGEFSTTPAPEVQAETGGSSEITSTSALVSGAVDPDGQAATYTFELGVDRGASTQYGVVFSGPVSASAGFEDESLQLTGLQPGTQYAYRIAIHFGDGTASGSSATGASESFTTAGVASALSVPVSPVMLAIPPYKFPVATKPSPRILTRAQKLANALKACKKKSKKKRVSCEHQARKQYGTKTSKKSIKAKKARSAQ